MTRARKVSVLGVPLDLGASKLGAAGGPDAIRRAELVPALERLGLDVEDRGDVAVPDRPARTPSGKLKHRAPILKTCTELCSEVYATHKEGRLPVVLGGDHSLAMGSVSGTAKWFRQKKQSVGLIWVDAHGDINTPETSPSGNIHGMPVAHLLGLGDRGLAGIGGPGPKVKARNVVLVGIRDLDANEKHNLRESGVNVFTMKEVDRYGMAWVAARAIEFASDQTAGVHVSFDIDAADPSVAQGTGTPMRGGLTYREAHLFMELVADSETLVSLDMVEINPLEDVHNQTAGLASELVQSALGKRIF
ncbi:MAG: arginase [Elusimicrobia bacterium]|nr:arginase [Elusimicrobiota bacterium]